MEAEKKRAKVTVSVLTLAALAILSISGYAGKLEPSKPPAPTMKTLDEVEPRTPVQSLGGSANAKYVIKQPGSYYLTGDVVVLATNEHGIAVEVNDVTINLKGYSLIGPGPGTSYGVYMDGRRNVEVCNGTVRRFGRSGIYEADGIYGRNHRVVNVRALSNGWLGIQLSSEGNLVQDCTSAGNGSTGVFGGYASTLTGNTVYENQGYGVSAVRGSTLTGNTIYNNDDAGILADSRCLVTGNTVSHNNQSNGATQAGIRVGNSCLIKANTANYNNRNNIYVSGSDNCIEENLVTNSTNGIKVSGTGNIIIKNKARANTTNYDLAASNSYGPVVNVASVGDISGTTNADHPWANFEF